MGSDRPLTPPHTHSLVRLTLARHPQLHPWTSQCCHNICILAYLKQCTVCLKLCTLSITTSVKWGHSQSPCTQGDERAKHLCSLPCFRLLWSMGYWDVWGVFTGLTKSTTIQDPPSNRKKIIKSVTFNIHAASPSTSSICLWNTNNSTWNTIWHLQKNCEHQLAPTHNSSCIFCQIPYTWLAYF